MFAEVGRRYTLQRKIGVGGMGVVYEAMDRESGATVALKTLINVAGSSLLRFKQEFRGLAELQHPNLVRLHELEEVDGLWFFTMDLIDGVDLVSHVCSGQDIVVPITSQTGMDVPPASSKSFPPEGSLTDQTGSDSADVLSDNLGALYDRDRLISAFRQLGRVLTFLHDRGKVHRDIKPSNILVTRSGKLVLLDFGLMVAQDRDEADKLTDAGLAGTAAYMAPEVAAEARATAASDWYSVGVILYQVLTGRLPFEGSVLQVLLNKQGQIPESPRLVHLQCDGDLADLAMALLDPDPALRPSGLAVLSRLGDKNAARLAAHSGSSGSSGADELFVGREREMGQLQRFWEDAVGGRSSIALVTGSSGIGKSALIARFKRHVRETTNGALFIFSGKCHERESVPFKGFDAVVDKMAVALLHEERRGHLVEFPPDMNLLVGMFPVLGRIRALSSALNRRDAVERSPRESRRRALAAFGSVLESMAAMQPILVFIDDIQWSDADSMDLLENLVSRFAEGTGPTRRVLFLLARRNEEQQVRSDSDLTPWARMEQSGAFKDVLLGPLGDQEARAMAVAFLDRAGLHGADLAERIAAESEGNPFFVGEMVRYLQYRSPTSGEQDLSTALSLDDVIVDRVSDLTGKGRRLLETLAVAGEALPHVILATAADVPMSDPDWWKEVSVLRGRRLFRCHGFRTRDLVETYHDRIRETVVGRMDEDQRRGIHMNLARAMEGARHVSVDVLARHWLAAGRTDHAKRYVIQAAKRAMEKLAFDRAAVLYEQAIELAEDPDVRVDLFLGLGDALASIGQVRRSADAYARAAGLSTDVAVRLDARYKAANQMLRGGYLDRGFAEISAVLSEIGYSMPKLGKRALVATGLARARLKIRGLSYKPRDRSEISKKDRRELDVLWSVSIGLSIVEPVLSALFGAHLMRRALDIGDETMIGGGFAIEAGLLSTNGEKKRREVDGLIERVEALAQKSDDVSMQGRAYLARCIAEFFSGNWLVSADMGNKAAEHFRDRCHGVGWELAASYSFVGFAFRMYGDLKALGEHVQAHHGEARRSGDRFLAANIETTMGLAWLAEDRAELVEEYLEHALDSWPQDRYQLQHFYRLLGWIDLLLYERRVEEACRLVDREMDQIQRALLVRVEYVESETLRLRARASLAFAPQCKGSERARQLRIAAKAIAKLKRQHAAMARGWADILDAALIWNKTGDRQVTEQALLRAVEILEAADRVLEALAARRRLAELKGDDAALRSVDEEMGKLGVVRPDRMTEVMSPGFVFS